MPIGDGLRVLLVSPTGRDAELINNALQLSGLRSEALENITNTVAAVRAGDVGALLLAEEALDKEAVALLAQALSEQPPWSVVPSWC